MGKEREALVVCRDEKVYLEMKGEAFVLSDGVVVHDMLVDYVASGLPVRAFDTLSIHRYNGRHYFEFSFKPSAEKEISARHEISSEVVREISKHLVGVETFHNFNFKQTPLSVNEDLVDLNGLRVRTRSELVEELPKNGCHIDRFSAVVVESMPSVIGFKVGGKFYAGVLVWHLGMLEMFGVNEIHFYELPYEDQLKMLACYEDNSRPLPPPYCRGRATAAIYDTGKYTFAKSLVLTGPNKEMVVGLSDVEFDALCKTRLGKRPQLVEGFEAFTVEPEGDECRLNIQERIGRDLVGASIKLSDSQFFEIAELAP